MNKLRMNEIRKLIEEHRVEAKTGKPANVESLQVLTFLVLPEALNELETALIDLNRVDAATNPKTLADTLRDSMHAVAAHRSHENKSCDIRDPSTIQELANNAAAVIRSKLDE